MCVDYIRPPFAASATVAPFTVDIWCFEGLRSGRIERRVKPLHQSVDAFEADIRAQIDELSRKSN